MSLVLVEPGPWEEVEDQKCTILPSQALYIHAFTDRDMDHVAPSIGQARGEGAG